MPDLTHVEAFAWARRRALPTLQIAIGEDQDAHREENAS
jgi:nicotinamide mononucleotide adenylyltransferase